MANINSFSENIRQLINNQNNTLASLTALQESMVSNNAFVSFNYTDKDGSTYQYQIPSYVSLNQKLQALENSINSLSTGEGIVTLNDGTYRTVKLSSIAKVPDRITGILDPSTFNIDSNWFFENLMFPGAIISINLKGYIEDSADRIKIKRVILNYRLQDGQDDESIHNIWNNSIYPNDYSYQELLTVLQNANISYSEDEQEVNLPLTTYTATGEFTITEDPTIENGNIWYKLDTINYYGVNSDGLTTTQNILSKGDQLSYENSIYTIVEINQNELKVKLEQSIGVSFPGINSVLSYYQDPFKDKTVNIRFGAHEYNIIYIKGISEEFNLLSTQWSTPIKFNSDSLIYEGDGTTSFANYYVNNIVDWGANWIAEVKDRKIAAFNGKIPNSPVLSDSDFKVVQINTQINAALDTADIKNVAAEIETVKSSISNLKETIAAKKTQLANTSKSDEYSTLQKQINSDITDLQNKQASYSTLVKNLQNAVKENGAVITNPKYHIRGFFPIPTLQYSDDNQTQAQEIIGFDIRYHYIKEDSTANSLEKYTYTDNDGNEITGVYSDWEEIQSPLKYKIWNSDLNRYTWNTENTADGNEININQIDIPISKGEKVEFMVRSISEAGYPGNCLKSEWSNSVIISFPSSLATDNEIANLITEINDDALNITINDTLSSVGLTSHISDSIPNTNSVNGLYYNHIADNIAYEYTDIDTSITKTISVQEAIDNIKDDTINKVNSIINSNSIYSDVENLKTCCSNVQTTIEDIYSKINYILSLVGPQFDFTLSLSPSVVEYGSTNDITVSWDYTNMVDISTAILSNNNSTIDVTGISGSPLTSYTYNDFSSSDNTFSLTATNINENNIVKTVTKSITLSYMYKLFLTTSTSEIETLKSTNNFNNITSNDYFVKSGSTLEISNVKTNKQYVYILFPSQLTLKKTLIDGGSYTAWNNYGTAIYSLENGETIEYTIYRTGNMQSNYSVGQTYTLIF